MFLWPHLNFVNTNANACYHLLEGERDYFCRKIRAYILGTHTHAHTHSFWWKTFIHINWTRQSEKCHLLHNHWHSIFSALFCFIFFLSSTFATFYVTRPYLIPYDVALFRVYLVLFCLLPVFDQKFHIYSDWNMAVTMPHNYYLQNFFSFFFGSLACLLASSPFYKYQQEHIMRSNQMYASISYFQSLEWIVMFSMTSYKKLNGIHYWWHIPVTEKSRVKLHNYPTTHLIELNSSSNATNSIKRQWVTTIDCLMCIFYERPQRITTGTQFETGQARTIKKKITTPTTTTSYRTVWFWIWLTRYLFSIMFM